MLRAPTSNWRFDALEKIYAIIMFSAIFEK